MWPAEGGVGAHRCERTHASCLPYLTCARVLCLAKGAGATFLRSAYVLGLVATGNFAWYNRKVCALPCALSLSCLLAFSCLCEGLHASVSSASRGSRCVGGAAQWLEPHSSRFAESSPVLCSDSLCVRPLSAARRAAEAACARAP